jgi:hypothetical protein
MLLRSCLICPRHEIRGEEGERQSYCGKENCWSRYSKCIATRAIQRFLEEDQVDGPRPFSALSHVYSQE